MEDPFRDHEFDPIFCIHQLGSQKQTPKKVFPTFESFISHFSFNTPCQRFIQKINEASHE